jgi:phosphate transport system protein
MKALVKAIRTGCGDRADAQINDLRLAIEQECYRLLATKQPVARDMRTIVAALTVVGDLERVGDHAKKIARTYLRIMENPRPIPAADVQRLADIALICLRHASLRNATSRGGGGRTTIA